MTKTDTTAALKALKYGVKLQIGIKSCRLAQQTAAGNGRRQTPEPMAKARSNDPRVLILTSPSIALPRDPSAEPASGKPQHVTRQKSDKNNTITPPLPTRDE